MVFEKGHLEITTASSFTVRHNRTTLAIEDSGRVTIDAAPQARWLSGGCEITLSDSAITVTAPSELSLVVGGTAVRISADGVELSGASVKSAAILFNEITGLPVKMN